MEHAANRTAGIAVAAIFLYAHIGRCGTALAAAVTVGPRRTCIAPTPESLNSHTGPLPYESCRFYTTLIRSAHRLSDVCRCIRQEGFSGLTAGIGSSCAVVAANAGTALPVAIARAADGTCSH
jgi:hypothetical protein